MHSPETLKKQATKDSLQKLFHALSPKDDSNPCHFELYLKKPSMRLFLFNPPTETEKKSFIDFSRKLEELQQTYKSFPLESKIISALISLNSGLLSFRNYEHQTATELIKNALEQLSSIMIEIKSKGLSNIFKDNELVLIQTSALCSLGKLHRITQQWTDAETCFADAARLAKEAKNTAVEAIALSNQAILLNDQWSCKQGPNELVSRALKLHLTSCELDPNSADCKINYANGLIHAAMLDKSYYDQALQATGMFPNNPHMHRLRAELFLHQGEFNKAQIAITKALEFDGKNPHLLYLSAQIHTQLANQQVAEAIQFLNEKIEIVSQKATNPELRLPDWNYLLGECEQLAQQLAPKTHVN
ncbi:MAG: tetratricopeptide repeat protein, partial [Gammaproteobacteria bacterium]